MEIVQIAGLFYIAKPLPKGYEYFSKLNHWTSRPALATPFIYLYEAIIAMDAIEQPLRVVSKGLIQIVRTKIKEGFYEEQEDKYDQFNKNSTL